MGINDFQKGYQPRTNIVKDEKGDLFTYCHSILPFLKFLVLFYSFIFDVLLAVHLSIFISVINQLDAHNLCFTISLLHASTCFEYMCSSSRGQNCIT